MPINIFLSSITGTKFCDFETFIRSWILESTLIGALSLCLLMSIILTFSDSIKSNSPSDLKCHKMSPSDNVPIYSPDLEIIGIDVEELSYYSDKREYHKRRLCDETEVNEIVDELIDAHWELLYTDKDEFYTSDNPVVIIERQDMPVTYCDAIKYFDDIYFPLNSNLLLHIVAGQPVCNKYISIQTIEQDKVNEINRIIKNKAPHYILYKNRYY